MKKLSGENHTYVLYDNIKEMSVAQYKSFIKATFVDSGLGSDMEAVRDKIVSIWGMLETNKLDLARNELNNIYNASNFILNKLNTTSECIVYLLYSIDGKKLDFEFLSDIEIEDIRKEIEKDLSVVKLQEVVDEVKKNYQPS